MIVRFRNAWDILEFLFISSASFVVSAAKLTLLDLRGIPKCPFTEDWYLEHRV